jgi:carotenoid cleavage dioxygenase-like enzyme
VGEHAAARLKEAHVAHVEGVGPACGGLHHVQAYENDDGCGITLITCLFRDLDLTSPFGWTANSSFFNCELHPDGQTLTRIQVNLTSNRAVGAQLLFDVTANAAADDQGASLRKEEIKCDFPTVNPNREGKRSRFAYAVTSTDRKRAFPFQVLRKIDMEQLTAFDSWCAPAHCFLGEPIFVPEPKGSEEDDGWVICVMYDTYTPSSITSRGRNQRRLSVSMAILDARNLSAGPLAFAHLSKPFPFGFHTSFRARASVSDADVALGVVQEL